MGRTEKTYVRNIFEEYFLEIFEEYLGTLLTNILENILINTFKEYVCGRVLRTISYGKF